MRTSICMLAVAALAAGCGGEPAKPPPKRAVLKVVVLGSGQMFADGVEVTPAELDIKFAGLRHAKGTVWLYREGGRGVPPAEAMQVVQMTVKHALPVRVSHQPDFSDMTGK